MTIIAEHKHYNNICPIQANHQAMTSLTLSYVLSYNLFPAHCCVCLC